MITQKRLQELLDYKPETGVFTWRVTRSHAIAGAPAGWTDEQAYLQIGVDGVRYQASRLAWLYMTGEWPPSGYIDHRNTIPSDNRWQNLRDATKRTNQENRRRPGKNNKAGLLGVSPNGARWSASIVSHRRKRHLGTFDTPKQAHAAYIIAKRQLHEGCTL
jgi:hypothetical protein